MAYQQLITNIDFSTQVLVAFSAGEMKSFIGKMEIIDVYQYTGSKDLPVNLIIKIGVLNDSCKDDIISLPFVLAVLEKPAGFQRIAYRSIGGHDVAFVVDDCSELI